MEPVNIFRHNTSKTVPAHSLSWQQVRLKIGEGEE